MKAPPSRGDGVGGRAGRGGAGRVRRSFLARFLAFFWDSSWGFGSYCRSSDRAEAVHRAQPAFVGDCCVSLAQTTVWSLLVSVAFQEACGGFHHQHGCEHSVVDFTFVPAKRRGMGSFYDRIGMRMMTSA
ncbi:hypothetical protein Mp_2g21680 [Marchantia polymorpha subsp. ruderalis]|uniref:Uncharacterized protein n=1 Tax=Marchantia polymorpha TaxID=3197 RepID=A0A2R6X2M5_MARPO|nr:hypothetical protein MARPO_0040s0046 [Marchantia polymorpha]BBN03213.1 hypothetical protein Mp_2g21680 [Marchantia polymorpha subsp. ruderalis]|eukprot:PTQ40364.1 hypothetical protein MARPO_0040s0046 [Marchantia polymorpha]